jgi:hypothetical protein
MRGTTSEKQNPAGHPDVVHATPRGIAHPFVPFPDEPRALVRITPAPARPMAAVSLPSS